MTSKQDILREQIKAVEDEIMLLHKKKFELKKELLQEIHKFKIGDFAVYQKYNGNIVYGRIDIINNTNNTKSGSVILHKNPLERSENYFMDDQYVIVHLHDWAREPDERLRVLSMH